MYDPTNMDINVVLLTVLATDVVTVFTGFRNALLVLSTTKGTRCILK